MIITIDRDFGTSVDKDPGWAAVRAVKHRRVHVHQSPTLPFAWVEFPLSVNRVIGLRWLTKILYPTRFPKNLNKLTRNFFTLFYHRTPSDPQIAQVLMGRC